MCRSVAVLHGQTTSTLDWPHSLLTLQQRSLTFIFPFKGIYDDAGDEKLTISVPAKPQSLSPPHEGSFIQLNTIPQCWISQVVPSFTHIFLVHILYILFAPFKSINIFILILFKQYNLSPFLLHCCSNLQIFPNMGLIKSSPSPPSSKHACKTNGDCNPGACDPLHTAPQSKENYDWLVIIKVHKRSKGGRHCLSTCLHISSDTCHTAIWFFL